MAACFTAVELEELARYDAFIDSLDMTEEDYAASRHIDELTLTKEQIRTRKHYRENKEYYLAKSKAYYEKHSEQIKQYKAEWYQANRERIRKQQAAYYIANKQRIDSITHSEFRGTELKCRYLLKKQGYRLEKKRSAPGLSCSADYCRYRISAGDQSGSDYPLRIEDVMQAAGLA